MVKILFLFNFVLWCCATGFVEAILFSKQGSDAFKWNEHIVFNIQRILVATLALIATYLTYNVNLALLFLSCVCSFSFWHNGSYYEGRKRIDMPEYNFFSNSTTSTALLELQLWQRTLLFILGLVVFLFV